MTTTFPAAETSFNANHFEEMASGDESTGARAPNAGAGRVGALANGLNPERRKSNLAYSPKPCGKGTNARLFASVLAKKKSRLAGSERVHGFSVLSSHGKCFSGKATSLISSQF